MKKIIIGGILGGIALFLWGFIAHLPPLGTAGERALSPAEEDAVLRAMRGAMRERAVYILPRADRDLAKFEAGPAAVVAYNPRPADQALAGSPFATYFLIEFLADIAAALLGAVVAANLSPALRYWPRVFILAGIGLLATMDIDVGYWNWYAFPTPYLLAQFVDHVGGWLAAGLIMARVAR